MTCPSCRRKLLLFRFASSFFLLVDIRCLFCGHEEPLPYKEAA